MTASRLMPHRTHPTDSLHHQPTHVKPAPPRFTPSTEFRSKFSKNMEFLSLHAHPQRFSNTHRLHRLLTPPRQTRFRSSREIMQKFRQILSLTKKNRALTVNWQTPEQYHARNCVPSSSSNWRTDFPTCKPPKNLAAHAAQSESGDNDSCRNACPTHSLESTCRQKTDPSQQLPGVRHRPPEARQRQHRRTPNPIHLTRLQCQQRYRAPHRSRTRTGNSPPHHKPPSLPGNTASLGRNRPRPS